MGYERVEFKIAAAVSRHNSDRDIAHDLLWAEVIEKIEKIINDPKYADIAILSL